MFTTLFIREIQNYLYSLRFQVSSIIVLLVFVIGSISFIRSFSEVQDNYAKYRQEQLKMMEERVQNASRLAVSQTQHIMSPRENSLISDCKELVLPNQFSYSAYNVFGFSVRLSNANPLMKQAQALNWSFIVSMLLGFITLLFAYDAISGEKEDRTLALCLSNPVSRGTILFAKLLSIITVIMSILVMGILISLLIMSFSGSIRVDTGLISEAAGFVGISALFIATMAVIGLLSSVLTRNSNVSLLISLCCWLVFAVIIPNTSVFWANKLFPIAQVDEVNQRINEGRETLNREAPDGSWSSSGDPFFPRHELRANLQTKLLLNEKQHRDAYYADMFRQFENTRLFTMISPMAQFDYMNEAMLGGGYLRFRKNWEDLHIFQPLFEQWFKDLDAKDDQGSPHWYNPYEALSTTRQAVSMDQIPVYTEQPANFVQRLGYMRTSLIFLSVLSLGVFMLCFVLLVRYDVR
jgi:ABC-type transport system involved in multi-copper enzyme maturation permease subunit